ncbi:MAG TPA: formylmethanofuran dehydrogenase subunit C [Pirellulales bacterium]|jgi:formylmethanofuran dehydrogenase subunit C
MPLRLTLRALSDAPIEVLGVIPSALRERSMVEIERTPILHGNRQAALAEWFAPQGDASDGRLEFEGDLRGVHRIGARMDGGEIHVTGDAGRHVGAEMTSGSIHVHGAAGDWLGAELRGGRITVAGDAGDFVGAAYRGSPEGMTGGEILVRDNVGHEVAHTMRRGLLAVGGSIGNFAAINMIAGSVFAFGACGVRPAAGMRRGTLALFGPRPTLLPTFRSAGLCQPLFVRVYLRALAQAGFVTPEDCMDAACELFHGDLVTTGRGEILLRA